MSVIYEALKKVEKGKAGPILQNFAPKVRNKAKLVYFVFVGIALVFIAGIYFQYLATDFYSEDFGSIGGKSLEPQHSYIKQERAAVPIRNQEKGAKYNLQGIVYSDSNSFAFINGKKVRRGDVIEEAKVVGISQAGVELKIEGGRVALTLE